MKILYQNRDIIVIDKYPGEQSEEGGDNSVPSLIRNHLGNDKAYVGVVHRLDTATGGLMVYALNRQAAAALSGQIAENKVIKEYILVCSGRPEPAEGTFTDFLFKDSRKNKVFPVRSLRKGAREAVLDYKVLSTVRNDDLGEVSLCTALLHTGRTHQVRVQFASRRHPLLGDGKYGSRVKGPLALYCHRLGFVIPGEKEMTEFSSEPVQGFFTAFSA